MIRKPFLIGCSLVIALGMVLTACSGNNAAPAATPTVDKNLIYTQAAQTVEAGIQLTQASQPSPTASATLAPTQTTEPTAAALLTATTNALLTPQTTLAATATLAPGAATQTPVVGAGTVQATATQAAGLPQQPTSGDKCEYVSQSPADGTKIQKDATWDMTFVIKNTGTTTWTPSYALKYFAGDKLNSPNDLLVTKNVKPGELTSFVFSLKAPTTTGEKNTIWVIQNPDGLNFCTVFLKIEVTD